MKEFFDPVLKTNKKTSLSQFSSAQSLSHVRLFATPWTAAYQAPPSIHGLSQARVLEWVAISRPPCPSLTPRVYSNSCPLSQWYHPTISSSVVPFSSHLQSFPASGSFQSLKQTKKPSGVCFIKLCAEIQKVLLSHSTHTRRLISVVEVLVGVCLSPALESSSVGTSAPQLLMFVWYCPKEGKNFLTMSPKID